MPATQTRKEFHALCHEHHVQMRLSQVLPKGQVQKVAYACDEADCFVRYSVSRGYFLSSRKSQASDSALLPKVRCFLDGTPMYLAEINRQEKGREKKGFRLWRCPKCDARRTNEEGLVSGERRR